MAQMTIEKHIAEPLVPSLFPNIPKPDAGVVKKWKCEGIDIRLIRNGIPMGEESIVALPWAIVGLYEGKMLYALTLEKMDLRILSSMTGCSVKELQADYGIRGFFSPVSAVMYGDESKEDLGVYPETNESEIERFLVEALLDSFDLVEEMEEA